MTKNDQNLSDRPPADADNAPGQAENIYGHLFEMSPTAMSIVDVETRRTVDVNRIALEMYGYTREELLQMDPGDLSVDPPLSDEEIAELVAGGRGGPLIRQHRRKDGTIFPVEITTSTLHVNGRVMLCGALRDISGHVEAERALNQTQESYKLVTDHIPVVVHSAFATPDGPKLLVSGRVAELTGHTAEEFEADRDLYSRLVYPDDRKVYWDRVNETIHTLSPMDIEYRIIAKDGTLKWVRERVVITPNDHGGVRRLDGILEDISDRRAAEQKVLEGQQRYRALFEGSHDAIMTLAPPSWNFTSGNPATVEMFGGADEEEFISQSPWQLSPEFQPDGADSPEKARQMIEMAMEKGSHFFEWTHKRLNGEEFPATVLLTRMTLGDQTFLQATVRDITEHKRSEEALQESEERLRSTMSSIDDLVFVHDADGVFLDYYHTPDTSVLYVPPEVFLGKHFEDVLPPAVAKLFRIAFETVKEMGAVQQFDYALEIGGRQKWYSAKVSPRTDADGGFAGATVVARDVTARKQAEQDLRDSEERLKAAQQLARVGSWTWDLTDNTFEMSDEMLRIHGLSKADALTDVRSMVETAVHPDDRRYVQDRVKAVSASEPYEADDMTFRVVRPDGEIRWIVATPGRPWRTGPDGQPTVMMGTLQDITERREAEQDLALNARMVSASSLGITAYRSSGECIMVNDAAAGLVGGTRDQLLAQNFRHIASWQGTPMLARAEEALAAGEERSAEITVTSTFGKEVSLRCRFLGFEFQDRRYLMMLMEDISERLRAQSDLRSERDKLQGLIDGLGVANVGIDIVDSDFHIQFQSEFLLGRFGNAVGRLCYETYTDYDAPCEGCPLERFYQGDLTVAAGEQVGKDGRLYEIIVAPLVDSDGQAHQTIQIVRDVTDQRRMERQLIQTQKMEAVGHLAAGVAHDFRNQLAVIKGYAEMLLRRSLVNEDGQARVREILAAAERSAGTARQLLAISRAGGLESRVVCLCDQVEDLGRSLPTMLGEDIRLTVDAAERPCKILVDPNLLQQALLNLALNARDAMPTGGDLIIKAGTVGITDTQRMTFPEISALRLAYVSVRDTGCGMDAATREHIFEPFFTTKATGHGTGLGMSVVYGFVQQSGGFIECDSAPGEGTTLRLFFPATDEPLTQLRPTDDVIARGAGGTILVVEDEDALRNMLASSLAEADYTILTARDGNAALTLADAHDGPIDLVITDIVLPGITGLVVTSALRKSRPEIRVLFITGYTGRGPDLGKEAGGAVLIKPISYADLLNAVADALNDAGKTP